MMSDRKVWKLARWRLIAFDDQAVRMSAGILTRWSTDIIAAALEAQSHHV
jgi:hypothetical protein